MKIAFVSCFSAALYPDQPVWKEILQEQPDQLVLLGDAIYLDFSGFPTADGDDGTPVINVSKLKELLPEAFARHAYNLYKLQWQQQDFQKLLASGVQVHAIWDDHDFLWNDARGADLEGTPLGKLVYPSRAMFAAWRQALASRQFPSAPPAFDANTPAPGYSCVALDAKLYLHLTDGRSWRAGHGQALLGDAQLEAMRARMEQAPPGTTHLVASGTTLEHRPGEAWMNCPHEYNLLRKLAQEHNVLVLSGDIHENTFHTFDLNAGRKLFEATSSGAALRKGVFVGSRQRNWGLLDVGAEQVRVALFPEDPAMPDMTIDRKNWVLKKP